MLLIKRVAVVLTALALVACSKVPAGNVGVKFDLYGGDKGITGEVVGPGKYWLGWNEELYLFPTFTQNFVWTKDARPGSVTDESVSFQDSQGIVINADIGISYAIQADKADTVFQKYRKGIGEITDIYLRNMVLDAVNAETSKMGVEEIYGNGKEELMVQVTKRVREQVKELGIQIEKIYWIGAMRLPPTITTAINSKIEATQKAQQRENELQTAKAQAEIARENARGEADAKLIAAQAQAKANQLLEQSITTNLVAYKAVETWNGILPTVMGGSTPFVNLPAGK